MTAIEYFGHSCFRITADDGWRAVLDPFAKYSVPGIELPEHIEAEEVLCSHGHEDHNAKELIRIVKNKTAPMNVRTITVPHDDMEGAKRGMNLIHILDDGNTRIAHFGDIGRPLSEKEIEQLKGLDVAMIPCGGYFTIDAEQAKKMIDEIQPKLTILMHYRTDHSGYTLISHLKDVKKVFTDAVEVEKSEIEVGEYSGIIIMNSVQG